MCQKSTVSLYSAIGVAYVLHGNMASVIFELSVRIAICFVSVYVIQNVLKVALAVFAPLADFIVESKNPVSLTCGPCSFVFFDMIVVVRLK